MGRWSGSNSTPTRRNFVTPPLGSPPQAYNMSYPMLRSLRDLRTLLLLAVALCAPGQAATFGAGTDLDGDDRVDLATAGHVRRDGAGYLLDISIRLSAAETRAITVHTSRAAGRMFARDIDGDSDRDLIVESFDFEPLAIVLNDGGGEFHQGSLEQFHAILGRHDLPFADAPATASDTDDPMECPASPADAVAPETSGPMFAPTRAAVPVCRTVVVLRHVVSATRGPPSLL